MWYVIDPIFAEKDTPQACLETYFRYFLLKKRHPLYAKKLIFVIFAEITSLKYTMRQSLRP